MITKQDTNNAAQNYEDSLTYSKASEQYDVQKAFKAGANWRINTVWHKPCDIAEPGKDCLVEHMDGDGNVCICIDWRSEYEWVNACHYDKVLRWAYVKDLLPNKEA